MATHFHKHIRLRDRDYTQGAYFVTLCASKRANIFGTVVHDTVSGISTQWVDATGGSPDDAYVQLNDVGRIVDECWRAIPDHFPHVRLDETQIMPDHLHAILILDPPVDLSSVGSTIGVDTTGGFDQPSARPKGPAPGSLGAIIGAFKSVTTKRINLAWGRSHGSVWQDGYYERVIRRQGGEYGRIAQYIAENPAKWR